MKIYTKTGDSGTTSLVDGTRVPKTHERLEAYGSVDELNSWLGLIVDQEIDNSYKKLLLMIQNNLFVVGSHLASPTQETIAKLPRLHDTDIELLEKSIDKMNETLPDLHGFVLPGGSTVASYCQIARTVCRKAERNALRIENHEQYVQVLKYLNRLSDFLFVLARTLAHESAGKERYWTNNK